MGDTNGRQWQAGGLEEVALVEETKRPLWDHDMEETARQVNEKEDG